MDYSAAVRDGKEILFQDLDFVFWRLVVVYLFVNFVDQYIKNQTKIPVPPLSQPQNSARLQIIICSNRCLLLDEELHI